MRRWIGVVVLMWVVLFSGCEKTDEPKRDGGSFCNYDVSAGKDAAALRSEEFQLDMDAYHMCEEGIFFVRGAMTPILCFYDFELGETLALCDRPNCPHNDQNCHGYAVMANAYPFVRYEDRVYYFTHEKEGEQSWVALWSCGFNGADRKRVLKLAGEAWEVPEGNGEESIAGVIAPVEFSFQCAGGRFVFTVSYDVYEESGTRSWQAVVAVNPKDGSVEFLADWWETGGEEQKRLLTVYGDYVLYERASYTEAAGYRTNWQFYSLAEDGWDLIPTVPGEYTRGGVRLDTAYPMVYPLIAYAIVGNEQILYRYDLETNAYEELFRLQESKSEWLRPSEMDWSWQQVGDEFFAYYRREDGTLDLHIYDLTTGEWATAWENCDFFPEGWVPLEEQFTEERYLLNLPGNIVNEDGETVSGYCWIYKEDFMAMNFERVHKVDGLAE